MLDGLPTPFCIEPNVFEHFIRIDIEPNYKRKTIYHHRPEDLTEEPAWELVD